MRWNLDSHVMPRDDRRMPSYPPALIALTITLVAASFAVLAFAAPSALAAFPGGNGKIAFHTYRDGNSEVYIMNPDGASQTRLTNNTAIDSFPAWSADGTKIAFYTERDGNAEIYRMNPDGTSQTRLTNNTAGDYLPAWSPDGTKIAFYTNRDGNYEIYTMNADGTGPTRLTNNAAHDLLPAWSPNGDKIAFVTNRDGNDEIYTMNPDGTSQTRLTNNTAFDGNLGLDWSADGTKIAFNSSRDGNSEIYRMNADGTSQTRLTNNAGEDLEPAWSPDSTKIAFVTSRDGNNEIYTMNADGTSPTRLTNNAASERAPDWQPLTNNYARPQAATPIRVALVPSYKQCTNTNTRHKGALSIVSCNPPKPESSYLTVGTPDFNGQIANAAGYIEMKAFCNGGGASEQPPCSTTAGDQLDAKVTVSQTDVRCQGTTGSCPNGALTDYVGNLMVMFSARITDKNSGGNGSATVLDITFGHAVTCATTGDTAIGSTCSSTTSFDALLGGASVITEQKRAIWDLEDIKVYDGGADGVASTQGDNTLFESGGLFFP